MGKSLLFSFKLFVVGLTLGTALAPTMTSYDRLQAIAPHRPADDVTTLIFDTVSAAQVLLLFEESVKSYGYFVEMPATRQQGKPVLGDLAVRLNLPTTLQRREQWTTLLFLRIHNYDYDAAYELHLPGSPDVLKDVLLQLAQDEA